MLAPSMAKPATAKANRLFAWIRSCYPVGSKLQWISINATPVVRMHGRHPGGKNVVRVELDTIQAYRMRVDDVLAALGSEAAKGLSADAVRARLARYGPNVLVAEEPIPAGRKFLGQFQDRLVILLLIATVISLIVWLYERDAALPYEAIAIFSIVFLNAVMGYMQTSRAEQAIASLRAMSPATARCCAMVNAALFLRLGWSRETFCLSRKETRFPPTPA